MAESRSLLDIEEGSVDLQGPPAWTYFTSDSLKITVCILTCMVIWNLEPPDKLIPQSIHILAVGISVIQGILLTSYPISMIIGLGLSVLVASNSLICNGVHCATMEDSFGIALSGLSQPVSWMIFTAFHLGKAVEITNLGKRIAYLLLQKMGGTIIGLGFAIFVAELSLAPFIPSNTARGGGIVLPIVTSIISTTEASSPGGAGEKRGRTGKFLIMCASHSNLLVSSVFITACAPNPIIVATAYHVLGLDVSFFTWTAAAVVPALACFCILPLLFYRLIKPEYDGSLILETANSELHALGPVSRNETKLIMIMSACLFLWMTEDYLGMPSTFVPFMALFVLLFVDVLEWSDVTRNATAWDTLFWLSGMLVLAHQLTESGITALMGDTAANMVSRVTDSGIAGACLLGVFYFMSMCTFSSITAHAVALAGPFFAAGKAIGCPPMLLFNIIAAFTSLSACLTTYSSGPVVLYFTRNYFSQHEWFAYGFLVGAVYLLVYYTIGLVWWTILGIY